MERFSQKRRLISSHRDMSNQSLEPTAGRRDEQIDFIKQFSMFAALAAASGGSAPSR
jgi:hypothetical protein